MLGQALDLAFEVRLDSVDESSSPCISVDVLQGDVRVDPGRLRISVEPVPQSQDILVRLRSTVVVEEPLVSVLLRAGCTQNTTRRYEFLTDFPPELRAATAAPQAAPVAPLVLPQAAAVPAPAPVVTAPLPPARATAPARAPEVVTESAVPAAPRPARPPVVRPPKPPVPPKVVANAAPRKEAEPAPGKPRLKLDPAELTPAGESTLKASPGLQGAPSEDNAQRADAAALWRALNASPQDVAAEAKRLQDAEAANKALRESVAKNDAKFAELQARLQRMEEERYANGVVYGLGALLLAALAGLAFLWRRRQAAATPPEWWRQQSEPPAATVEPHHDHELVEVSGAASTQPSPSALQGLSKVDVDIDVNESMFDSLKQAPAPAPVVAAAPRAAQGMPRGLRAVNPEDLFDIQQHAEFFVSLGQYDQAIDVLRKHIAENPGTSPLAYLDLLKIHHTLSRTEAYNQLRDEFQKLFNGRVPPFASFTSEGRTLEDYPEALAEIQSLWPAPQVLEIIEDHMFRRPDAPAAQPFDLAAYRELLLLYAMVKSGLLKAPDAAEDGDAGARLEQLRNNRAPAVGAPLAFEAAPVRQDDLGGLASVSAALSELPSLPTPGGAGGGKPEGALDLDLSDASLPSVFAEVVDEPPLPKVPVEIDFQLSVPPDAAETQPPAPAPAAAPKDNSIDFDLFDPEIEAMISPKPSRH